MVYRCYVAESAALSASAVHADATGNINDYLGSVGGADRFVRLLLGFGLNLLFHLSMTNQ